MVAMVSNFQFFVCLFRINKISPSNLGISVGDFGREVYGRGNTRRCIQGQHGEAARTRDTSTSMSQSQCRGFGIGASVMWSTEECDRAESGDLAIW